ncbi:hypothetical protein [Deinococcus fonticola]|uniref:hypothetical protein n=1 Tax=Deinococcus fonticola TaxID=2528713 RepID=UPI00107542EA|nr:hypothetical protein [Deinococcus fonticola]
MDRDELLDALLTWGDPSVMQERLHGSRGVTLSGATEADLRAVLEELEDEELELGVAFSWEVGDLSPYEYGDSHKA